MLTAGPRRALAALYCVSSLLPAPAFSAAVAEIGVRPVAPSFAAAPAATFAPALTAAPLPAASAAPNTAPAAMIEAAAAPAAADERMLAPERASEAASAAPSTGAREKLRAATLSVRALAFLTISALLPKSAPVPAERYLRENQDYAVADKRGVLADGSVVEAAAGSSAYRSTFAHPGMKTLLSRADAVKTSARTEDEKLSDVRTIVADTLPGGRDFRIRAAELSALKRSKAVELGAYAERGRGGEREAALLANVALARAGFKPKLIRVSAWRRQDGTLVEGERTLNLVHTARGQILFDTVDPALDGRKPQDAGAVELDGPRVFSPAGKPKTSGVEAKTSGSKDLTFSVVGRSAADREFKDDQKKYEAAAAEEPVTVEWLYFPFYVDGHTALRIGDQLYEFTRRGWRASGARAFLFNNPYFDTQMARHPTLHIPPFSLGVPLTIKKREAESFAARAAADKGFFSFWFNNCNQVPYRFLRRMGIVLGDGVFASFSSIRSFRMLLLHPPAQAGAPRLYPLPNQANAIEPLGPAVPRDLVVEHSVFRDFVMFVWNWPKFIFEKLPLPRAKPAAPPAPKG